MAHMMWLKEEDNGRWAIEHRLLGTLGVAEDFQAAYYFYNNWIAVHEDVELVTDQDIVEVLDERAERKSI